MYLTSFIRCVIRGKTIFYIQLVINKRNIILSASFSQESN